MTEPAPKDTGERLPKNNGFHLNLVGSKGWSDPVTGIYYKDVDNPHWFDVPTTERLLQVKTPEGGAMWAYPV